MAETIPTDVLALIVGVASLVISVISFFIAWKAFDRDRSDLRIYVHFYPKGERGTFLQVELVNFGRREIIAENISLVIFPWTYIEYASYVPGMPTLPRIIKEAETAIYSFPINDYYKNMIPDPRKITSVRVMDSRKKIYRFPGFRSVISWLKIKRTLSKSFAERGKT